MTPIARLAARAATTLLACAGIVAAQNPAQQGTAALNDLLRQAHQLSARGEQDSALALYTTAMAAAPSSYQPHVGAGVALDLMGRYTEARQHLVTALGLVPAAEKAGVLRTMAISFAFQNDCAGAARSDRQAFDEQLAAHDYSSAAEIANELARICLEAGSVDRAYEWYQRGHTTALLQPALTDSARTLWEFRWEHAEARIAARRGLPAAARQHIAAAKALLDRGLNPDQRRFFPYLTGYVAFHSGDYHGAIAELQQADQNDPFILALLAQAHEKTGDRAQAMELYRRILTIHTHNPVNAFARPLARSKVATE